MQSVPATVNAAREMRQEGTKWQLETYNTDELLGKAFYFFECQESGKLRKGHRVKWRGDSYLQDGKDEGIDLVGGWHDAGGAHRSCQCRCFSIACAPATCAQMAGIAQTPLLVRAL